MQWTGLRFCHIFYSWVSQVIRSALGIPVLHLSSQRNTNLTVACHIWTRLSLFTLQRCEICLDLFQQTDYRGSPRVWSHWFIRSLIGFFSSRINTRASWNSPRFYARGQEAGEMPLKQWKDSEYPAILRLAYFYSFFFFFPRLSSG